MGSEVGSERWAIRGGGGQSGVGSEEVGSEGWAVRGGGGQ